MNKINIDLATGFPVQKKTFDFMQDAYSEAIRHLCLTFGDNLILYGVELVGTQRTAGAIVLNGELIPFKASSNGDFIVVDVEKEPVVYQSGQQMEAYVKRTARCSTVAEAGSFPLSDLKRVGEKPQATSWQNVTYLPGFENTGTGNMQSRIDESGKGLVVGAFVVLEESKKLSKYAIAQTSLYPKRRQPAMITTDGIVRFEEGNESKTLVRNTSIFGYVDIDGKLYVDVTPDGMGYIVTAIGFVSACIDLD